MEVILIMLKISMPRGDIRPVKFTVTDPNGRVSDILFDEIYFTVKRSFNDKYYVFQKKLSDGSIELDENEGYHTLASSIGSHVEGVLNEDDSDHQYVHITGIGYMDDNTGEPVLKNGFTVDWGGNGQFAGAITIADSLGTVTLNAARLRALLALVQNLPADTLMPGSEPYISFDPYGGGYE